MSYRGRPSKGCESCRARKVKCDENKPVCNRCTKSGHECKYRDQADLLFRNQTAFAAQRAEESWRKRSKSHQRITSEGTASKPAPSSHNVPSRSQQHKQAQRRESPSNDPSSASANGPDALAMLNMNSLSLHQELKTDLRRLAYERFIYDFVVFETPNTPTGSISDAMWDFIPVLYEKSAEGSCLATVVDAVSYANFANRCNAPQAGVLAQENLGKSIKLLQKTISDKKQAPTDEALCAVYLMGVYENLTIPGRGGAFLQHKEGANALLQLRTMEQFYTNSISARLYEVSYAQMLIGNLQAGKQPALPISNFIAAKTYLPSMYSTSGIYVIQLIHSAAKVHAGWLELKHSPNPPSSRQELRELLRAALELDADFQSWESTLPRSWRYQVERNTPEARSIFELKWRTLVLDHRGAPEEIHIYNSLKRCWVWMFYRTARIFLLRDLLEILNWMFRFPEPEPTPYSPSHDDMSPAPTPIDNTSLHIRYAFATTHIVNVMEKSCSAILAHFTVPVYGKSPDDAIGMRAYTSLWSLGVMDAVLRAGMVPDTNAPPTPPSSGGASPNQQQASAPGLSASPLSQPPAPSPNLFRMPAQSMSQLYHNPGTNVYQHNEFPSLSPMQGMPPLRTSASPPASMPSPPVSNPGIIDGSNPYFLNKHVFDSVPSHPFDGPTKLPAVDFPITKPARVHVAARREWLNRLLFYIAMEMGIKKAIAVPATEGYLDMCKREIGPMLGK